MQMAFPVTFDEGAALKMRSLEFKLQDAKKPLMISGFFD